MTQQDKKTEFVGVRIPANDLNQLKDISIKKDRSIGWIIRDAIKQYLKESNKD